MEIFSKRVFDAIQRKIGTPPNRVDPSTPNGEPRKIVNAHYKGHCFKCFSGDWISDFILSGRGWDNQLEQILDRALANSEGDVVEIGANIGASLIPISGKYPSHTFHCVEPVPDFFALLEANKESYKADNVKLYNQAIGAPDGRDIELHVQLGTAGAVSHYDGHAYFGPLKIPTVTIDSLFNGKSIALIKLDVDGFEMDVLRGATGTLERCLPKVFMEFHTKLMTQAGTQPTEITNLFEQLGYNRISVWSNFGDFISTTNSYQEFLELADSSQYYVDALFEHAEKSK